MKRAMYLALVVTLALGIAAPSATAQPAAFRAVLSGADEVPPRDTGARGVATFLVSSDDTEIGFRLVVANIENVVAAHIHCGDSDDVAPVGVTLFSGGAPASGAFNGVLATGPITGPDGTTTCPWTDLDDVIAALESGNAYVNVHTSDGDATPNEGPGDFPGGEIRGQVF